MAGVVFGEQVTSDNSRKKVKIKVQDYIISWLYHLDITEEDNDTKYNHLGIKSMGRSRMRWRDQ